MCNYESLLAIVLPLLVLVVAAKVAPVAATHRLGRYDECVTVCTISCVRRRRRADCGPVLQGCGFGFRRVLADSLFAMTWNAVMKQC